VKRERKAPRLSDLKRALRWLRVQYQRRAAETARGQDRMAPLELVERDIPEPGVGLVRIKVQARGVCHSNSLTKEGAFPGIQYPRVPGHEIAGVIDAVGPASWDGKPDRGSE
jgi:D-arabinose 1-dehydrogenase-like Zn-dependent alcohol dehydrogenase